MHPTPAAHPTRLLRLLTLLAIGAVLAVLASPALAQASDVPVKSWGAFLGRVHVLILHLPIGLIMGAFIIEFFGIFRRSRGYDTAAAWLFVLGAISAVAAVFTGLLLGTENAATAKAGTPTVGQLLFSNSDFAVSETLGWHMWAGIVLMVAAIAAAVLKVMAVRRQWKEDEELSAPAGWPLVVSRLSLIGAMALLPLAGHLGGNMVHERDYIFARAPFSVPESVINFPPEEGGTPIPVGPGEIDLVDASWTETIQPAFDAHCVVCHGPDKQRGGLRLDTLEYALESDVIEPGDAEASELYRRVILPPSHDEFMPKNVSEHGMLNLEEIHALGEWITEFNGTFNGQTAVNGTGGDTAAQPPVDEPLFDPQALNAIQGAGGTVQSLSLEEDPGLLTVRFSYKSELSPAEVATIGAVADSIAELTFEGSSAFDDAAAAALPPMGELVHLNLRGTAVTDAGLAALPDMPKLVWLNLFGTAVTDAGLASLERYTTLEKLYITGTPVTAEAVAALQEKLPNTAIYSDHDPQFQFATEPEPETEQSSAEAINTMCPVRTGQAINPEIFVIHEGRRIGFCCNNCKGAFESNPAQYLANLPAAQ